MGDPLRAAIKRRDLEGFATFCQQLRIESGAPLELYPEQQMMLRDYFDGVRETLILISKKNGKTTLLAALALYHLLTTPDAACVIGAASRDQATILYDQATGLVERSEVGSMFKSQKGYRRIDARFDRGRIRVLAADENTADGVIPTLALVDELHRHKTAGLYGIFRDGCSARGGQLITISTAGASLDSPLGLLRAKAYELPGLRRDGPYRYVRAPAFAMHEWALAPEADVDNLELVLGANPAPWQDLEQLRLRHDSPSMTPGQWRRFACGIWTEGEEPWLNPPLWDRLADHELELDPAAPTWVGVDVGVRKDSTAIVTVAQRGDGEVAVKARVLRPPSDAGLPLQLVEDAVREACADRNVQAVLFDPWTFRRSAELLAEDDLPMVEFPQSPERMANASENLYRLIETGALVHDGDPMLRAHVVAGAVKQTERGWRLVKDPRSSRPIDALIALAMAALPAAQNIVTEPAFAWG
jgi:phage terminase large subunit-like protein